MPLYDGILLLDKPAGVTSHDMVDLVRRSLLTKKVGHAGTLDPIATGLLVVLVGQAVKASRYASAERKSYLCRLKTGIVTDSDDITGGIIEKSGIIPGEEAVKAAVLSLPGKFLQLPPLYSALKVGGKKLVDAARNGVELERTARPVEVFSVRYLGKVRDDEFEFYAEVSKGTYLRAICRDIGAALGCGGTMSALRRLTVGKYSVRDAVKAEVLENEPEKAVLLQTSTLFDGLPRLFLQPFFMRLALNGNEVYQKKIGSSVPSGGHVLLTDGEKPYALAQESDYPDGSALKIILRL